jgi:hypothetical protein
MALPDYLEDTSKDFARQATAAYSAPINTDTFTGRQFVAGQDPLQTQAAALATQGVGSYSPYLQAAQTFQGQSAGALGDSASTIGGLGSLTGANAYQPFMSPYQTQVIDATLSEYDKSRLGGQQNIRDAAVSSGNFGGGREGAMMGQYNADSLVNRAALQNQMLQQGFTQANQLAQQNFTNQSNIGIAQNNLANAYGQQGSAQMGLSNFNRQGMGADINALGNLGALNQAQNQAYLSADQQQAQTGAYEPYGRLTNYGNAITGLSGGMQGQQFQTQAPSDPWQTALGTAMGVGGLYGKIFGKT